MSWIQLCLTILWCIYWTATRLWRGWLPARRSVWFALLLPAFNVYQSWYQGILLHARKTRGITEAIAISLFVTLVVLTVGVRLGTIAGLYVGWTAFSLGGLEQMFWLRRRSRPSLEALQEQA